MHLEKLKLLCDFEICQNQSRNSIFCFFVKLLVPRFDTLSNQASSMKLCMQLPNNIPQDCFSEKPEIFYFLDQFLSFLILMDLDVFQHIGVWILGCSDQIERFIIKLAWWNFTCSLLTVFPFVLIMKLYFLYKFIVILKFLNLYRLSHLCHTDVTPQKYTVSYQPLATVLLHIELEYFFNL